MAAWRRGRTARAPALFGVGALAITLIPAEVGHQDLAALIAQQPAVAERARSHVKASPFGTIDAATFNLPELISAAMPVSLSYALAGLDANNAELTGSIRARILGDLADIPETAIPTFNRRLKGDRLVASPAQPQTMAEIEPAAVRKGDRLAVLPPEPTQSTPLQAGKADRLDPEPSEIATAEPLRVGPDQIEERPEAGLAERSSQAIEPNQQLPERRPPTYSLANVDPEASDIPSYSAFVGPPHQLDRDFEAPAAGSVEHPDAVATPGDRATGVRVVRLYFGVDPMGQSLDVMRPWAPGEEPLLEASPAPSNENVRTASLTPGPAASEPISRGGETIARKGEVTGEGQQPMTPAERLKLDGGSRARAEKCLTDAIYFEARGEPVRGQIAVAQVVMNRVFSGYYPSTVCGVVYQNARHHLACQFTFACDGIRDVVREPDAWERAKKIAAETLDGKLWLPEVGKATHYHAYWVHPSWVREMTKMYKLGVHTFYRPKRWGDGAAAPEWGDAATTAAAFKEL
jgi:spore germination cell wall hydrolase CwlJ-like protein